jgi:tRNA(fMet)-specific endonuclease VapC
MTKYLLDTDTCIFVFRNKFGIKEKIAAAGQGACFISEITLAELFVGMYKSGQLEKRQQELVILLSVVTVVPIYETLPTYGKERARLEKLGTPIADFDLLIATTAVYHNMVLVTGNTRHHQRVDGLSLQNWT